MLPLWGGDIAGTLSDIVPDCTELHTIGALESGKLHIDCWMVFTRKATECLQQRTNAFKC